MCLLCRLTAQHCHCSDTFYGKIFLVISTFMFCHISSGYVLWCTEYWKEKVSVISKNLNCQKWHFIQTLFTLFNNYFERKPQKICMFYLRPFLKYIFLSYLHQSTFFSYGMTTSQRFMDSKPAGKFRCMLWHSFIFLVASCSVNISTVANVLLHKHTLAWLADMEWQTPAVSEKFQSRFGRRPGTSESGDTGLGTSASDSTEGEDLSSSPVACVA